MKARNLIVAAMIVGGNLAVMAPAHATCVGTQNTAGVCVENRTIYSDCVYVVSDTCVPVNVTGPRVVHCWLGDPSIIACA